MSLLGYFSNASRWIWSNTMGWAIAIAWIFGFAMMPEEDTSIWLIALAGLLAGTLSGISVGLITGLSLKRLHRI